MRVKEWDERMVQFSKEHPEHFLSSMQISLKTTLIIMLVANLLAAGAGLIRQQHISPAKEHQKGAWNTSLHGK